MTNHGQTGSDYLGSLPSGTHLCSFHKTQEALVDTTVSYFSPGLQQDEFCLWVTSDPSGVEAAKVALKTAAPYMDRYLDAGQIEIWDYRDWYLPGGHFDADRVFGQWVEKEKQSVDSGYNGFRASGDTGWLEERDRPEFMAYEAEVNRVFPEHRMVGLCTYPLDGCTASELLDVVCNHEFTLARIAGQWEMIGNSRIALTGKDSMSERLRRLSADILERQDERRRWCAAQLHEVTAQNVSAIALYLGSLQQRKSWPSDVESILAKCHALCEQSIEHILALSRVLHPLILDELGLGPCLRRYIEEFMKRSDIDVEFETGPDIGRLPLEVEIHLFRVAQEALANIRGHSGSAKGIVRLHRQADQVILQIEDFGRGMPAPPAAAVAGAAASRGTGILAMQERVRKIGGRLEIRSTTQGTTLTVNVGV